MEEEHVGQGGVDNQSSFKSAGNHSLRHLASQESDPNMGKGSTSNNNGQSSITKSSSSSLLGTQTSEKQQQPYAAGDGDGHTNLNNAISSSPTNRNVDEGGESNEQKKSQHLTNNDEKYVQEDAEEYKSPQTSLDAEATEKPYDDNDGEEGKKDDAEDAEKYKSSQISPKAEVTENANEDNDGEKGKKEAETPYEDNDDEKYVQEDAGEYKVQQTSLDAEATEKPYEDNDGEEGKKEAETPSEDNDGEESKEEAKTGAIESHEEEKNDNVVSDKEVGSSFKESRPVKGVSFGARSEASRKPLKTKSSASSARPLLPLAVGKASHKHEDDGEDGVSSGSEGKPWGSSLWIPAIVGGIIAAFIFGKVKFSHRRKQPHSDAL